MSKNKELKENAKVPVVMDFAADAGAGMEEADKSSYAIPFITLLQGLSPQIETVDGAKPGLFINTITNELYKTVKVAPCSYQRRFIRWAPRSAGGGYKGDFSAIEVETGKLEGMKNINGYYLMDVDEGAKAFDGEGRPLFDHLADTRNHFVLVQSESGSWQPALISLSSTQIKKSKRWMSRIQGIELKDGNGKPFTPPSFSHIYELKAVKEKNAKGEWWGYEFDLIGPVEDGNLYESAKAFHKNVAAGEVEVSQPQAENVAEQNDKF